MKMLILDDNKQVREGIQNGIDWNSLGILDIRSAGDGKEGLEIFQKFLPDIVLVDVMMPEIDGLEFLKIAKSIRPDTKALIISGFSEFDYAVKAMKYGASGYELKPIKMQQLMIDVSDLVQQIRSDRKKQEESMVHQMVYQKKIMQNIIQGKCADEELRKKFWEGLGVRSNTQIMFMNAAVDEADAAERTLNLMEQLFSSYFSNETEMIFLGRENDRFYIITKCSVSLLEQFNKQANMVSVLKNLNLLIADTGYTVSAGVSKVHTVNHISDCLNEANYALWINQMAGRASFRVYDKNISKDSIDRLYRSHLELFDKWKKADTDQVAEITAMLESLFRSIREQGYLEKNFCTRLTCLILEKIRQTYPALKDGLEEETEESFLGLIDGLESLDECENFCKDYLLMIRKNGRYDKKENHSEPIQKTINYIKDHYKQEITVPLLAEYIGISPNYLSHLFKNECGTTISEYINLIRIQKAKELIINSDMMIYEISEAVGYANYIRFTQVFKKYEGCSPTQYRKK